MKHGTLIGHSASSCLFLIVATGLFAGSVFQLTL